MKTTLSLIPMLAALLACKAGQRAEAEPTPTEATAEPAPLEGAAVEPASQNTQPARSDGKLELKVVEGVARTQHGFVIIPGEVRNDTSHFLDFVHVGVELFDAAGKKISVSSIAAADGRSEGVYTDRRLLPPGEVAVFRYTRDMKKLGGVYASHKLSARGRPTQDRMTASAEGLSGTADKLGFYTVTGKIRASTPAGCRSPQAVIAIYGDDGRVIDAKSSDLDPWFQKLMPAGEAGDFRRLFNLEGATVKSFKVWGDCRPR